MTVHREPVASDPENFVMDAVETRWYCEPPPHGTYYVTMEGSWYLFEDDGRKGKALRRITAWSIVPAATYDIYNSASYYQVSFRP